LLSSLLQVGICLLQCYAIVMRAAVIGNYTPVETEPPRICHLLFDLILAVRAVFRVDVVISRQPRPLRIGLARISRESANNARTARGHGQTACSGQEGASAVSTRSVHGISLLTVTQKSGAGALCARPYWRFEHLFLD